MSGLVSILIPAYNAERFVADTIRSALAQTWPHKEIIVVDDGSRDRTLEIATGFESAGVRVVSQANTGACGARNRAFSLCRGDYIQWLDADDLLHPEKIERQMRAAHGGGASRTLLTCAWAPFYFRPEAAKFEPDALWRDLTPIDWLVTKFNNSVWMNPTVWLVSRRLSERAGPWDERLTASGDDDGEYICRVLAASDGVRFVAEAKCWYRTGIPGSLAWNKGYSDKVLHPLCLTLELCIGHLLAMEDSPRTRQAALRYLQSLLRKFYGNNEALTQHLFNLARELGGELRPPTIGWKYAPIAGLFGEPAARRLMNRWHATKARARARLDLLSLSLTRAWRPR